MAVKDILLRLRQEGAKEIAGALGDVSKATKNVSDSMNKFKVAGTAIAAGGAAIVATMLSVKKSTEMAIEFAVLGDRINNLSGQFQQLATTSGHNYVELLANLKTATEGAISNTDLFQIANKALSAGLEENGLSLVEIADLTNKYADATGIDAKQAIETVTKAMATGRVVTLQAMGIQLDLTKATEEYAKSIGVAVEDLTEQEKKTIKQQAAMEGLRNATANLSEVAAGSGDAADRVARAWSDLVDEFLAGFDQSQELRRSFLELEAVLVTLDFRKLGEDVANFTSTIIDAASQIAKFISAAQYLIDQQGSMISHAEKVGRTLAASATTYEAVEAQTKKVRKATEEAFNKLGQMRTETHHMVTENKTYVGELAELRTEYLTQVSTLSGLIAQEDELRKQKKRLTNAVNTQGTSEEELADARRRGKKAADEAAEREKEIQSAVESLSKNYEDLINKTETESLERSLKEALKIGDMTEFAALESKIQEVMTNGLVSGYDDPRVDAAAEKLGELQKDVMVQKVHLEVAKETEEALKEAYAASTDFWESILIGMVEGNVEDVFKNMLRRAAVEFGAGILAQLSDNFSVDKLFGPNGFDITSLFGEGGISSWFGGAGSEAIGTNIDGTTMTSGAGAAAGGTSALITAGGYAAAAAYAYNLYDSVKKLTDNKGRNDRQAGISAALGSNPVTGWIPILASAFGVDLSFGSFGDKMSQERAGVFEGLSEQTGREFDIGDRGRFEQEWATSFQEIAGQGQSAFEAVGLAIERTGDLSAGVGSQIGFLLAENFGGSIAELLSLMDQVGLDASEMKEELKTAFLDGGVALEDFGTQLQGLNMLQEMNIAGTANIGLALEEMAKVIDGTPREKLIALELLWNEMGEAGVTSVADVGTALTDRLGPDAAAVFQRIENAGITSFDNISELSADQIYLIISETRNLETAIRDSFAGIAGSSGAVTDENTKIADSYREVERSARSATSAVKDFNSATRSGGSNNSSQTLGVVQ